MEELVTLDCLFIDGTKIESNANKYSFVWKKTTEKFSAKLQEQIQVYFQEEITPLLIKYAMFDKKQKRGYKESAKNLANWHYNDKEDSYIHPDGWCYRFHHIKHQKTQTDFQQEIKVYYADEPESAPQKGLYMNERYQNLKAKECQALLSPQDRQIFAQRKIDVEPVFGQIKACLGYKRCNLRGKRQVRIDMGLVLMANNLLKHSEMK
ncbi:transposase [Streptococcus pneumoniae]|nr:transposase [Streptococcus pneumoniae]COC04325.1 transposase [Streptococcus pneumoniae]